MLVHQISGACVLNFGDVKVLSATWHFVNEELCKDVPELLSQY